MTKSEGLAADFLARFARLVAFWLEHALKKCM